METKKDFKTNPKPAFYACCLEALRKAAKDCGYALAVHGSLANDLDLIAVQWGGFYLAPNSLVRQLLKTLTGTCWNLGDIEKLTTPERRYKTQLHYTLPISGDFYVDLTVIDPDIEIVQ